MIDLEACARSLVAPGKGLLAVDDPALDPAFRNLLLETPGIEEYLSGVLLHADTMPQKNLHDRDIVLGVTVDEGREPMDARSPEMLTKGLINLPERLATARTHHAGFAKWRATLSIHGDHYPSAGAIVENAKRLAMFAKQVQETGMVPIVEMDILPDGPHSRIRAQAATEEALHSLIAAMKDLSLDFSGILLETSMVRSGKDSGRIDTPEEVAKATIETVTKSVPHDLLGIVFLSGGQTPDAATDNLRAIVQEGKTQNLRSPLSFCFARVLQEEAKAIWAGDTEHGAAAQEAFRTRLEKVSRASRGE